MAARQNLTDAVLFVLGMPVLAAVIGGGLYGVMLAGSAALRGWHELFFHLIGLPSSAANALAVIASALCVYAAVYGIGLLLRRRRRA